MKLPTNANFINLTGKRYKRLRVIKYERSTPNGHTLWLCACVCGNTKIVFGSSLRRGTTTSCGCFMKEFFGKGHKNYKGPFRSLYNWFVANCKRAGRSQKISYKQFVNYTKTVTCYYCGDPVTWAEHNIHKNGCGYNLDRKDSSIGYTKRNCVVACKACNYMKTNFSMEEFLCKVAKISRRHPWKT